MMSQSALVYRVPFDEMSIAEGALAELAGYIRSMVENDRLPEYAKEPIQEYIHAARKALTNHPFEAVDI